MSDLPPEQLVASFDDEAELYSVTGWTAGPAGVARIPLGDDAWLDVETTNPQVTVELVVPAVAGKRVVHPDVWSVVEAVVGAGALGELERTASMAGARVLLGSVGGRGPRNHVRTALGRMALARSYAVDDDASHVDRAVGALEAVVLADEVPAMRAFLAVRDELLVFGAELAVDADDRGLFDDASRRVHLRLAELFRHVRRILDATDDPALLRLAIRIGALADGFDRRRDGGLGEAAAAASMEMPPAFGGRAGAPDPRFTAIPVQPEGTSVVARLAGEHHVTLAVEASDETRWARLFRRRDGLLLGATMLRPHTRIATLLVPPGHTRADVVVDVHASAAAPLASDPLEAARNAVRLGRRAAREDRRQSGLGPYHWRECAEAWDASGDHDRARLAEARRGGGRGRGPEFERYRGTDPDDPRTPPRPLLADQLQD